MHGKFSQAILALDRHNGRIRALRNHHGPLPLVILLGQIGNVSGNLADVLRAQRMGVGVRSGLGFVADQVVPVRGRLVERVLEELRDEWGAEAQGEHLVVGGGFFGQRQDGRHAHGQMVTADEVERGLLNERPDAGRLEMIDFVLVGGSQVRAHATVVTGDDDATAAGGDLGVHTIFHAEAGFVAGGAEDIGIFVGTDTADVEDALGWEDVLLQRKNGGCGGQLRRFKRRVADCWGGIAVGRRKRELKPQNQERSTWAPRAVF